MAPGLLDCLSLAVCAIIHSVQLFDARGSGESAGGQGWAGHHSHGEVGVVGDGAGLLFGAVSGAPVAAPCSPRGHHLLLKGFGPQQAGSKVQVGST